MTGKASHKLSRRELLRVLGAGSGGLILAACTPAAPQVIKETVEVEVEVPVEETVVVKETTVVEVTAEAPVMYEEGELRVLYCCSSQDDFDNLYIPYGDRFMDAHPGVTVAQELLPAGQNYFEKLQTLIAADEAPDVFDMWEGYVQPYAAKGLFVNMDPLIDGDPKISKEDIVPVAWTAGSWQGSLYSLLVEFMPGPMMMFYNTDHFDAAGQDYPRPDWTWDDMKAAAVALTKDDNGDGVPEQWGVVFDLWFVPWLYWIWSNGGDVFNADETGCALTDAAAVDALQYWADLTVKDKVAVTASELQTLGGGQSAFRTGAVSMYLGNGWDVGVLNDAKAEGLNWAGTLAPTANSGNRTWYMHASSFSISSQTEMPQTGWDFLRDWILELAPLRQTGIPAIPALKQLLYLFANPQNSALGLDPLLAMATDETLTITKVPGSGEKWDKISQMVQAEIDLVFIGEKAAAEAAATACPLVEEELAR
jgi:ABC-type glycerol-3-phosphate transport system substrate-binding protein